MMFNNGFALAIKKGGQVLRESRAQGGPPAVHLPFESEYSIFVKNSNACRALLKLTIDGMDVGEEFVIGAHSQIDIERFILDRNLTSGKKFKFVPVGDSRVQDPSDVENGVIKAELWKEETSGIVNIEHHHHHHDYYPRPPWRPYAGPDKTWIGMGGEQYTSGTIGSSMLRSCNFASSSIDDGAQVSSDLGATVEGAQSDQMFTETYFGRKSAESTVMEIYLRGSAAAITVKNTRRKTCTSCKRQTRRKDKYCPSCGAALPETVST